MGRLPGRRALVTGGGRGIGAEIARALAREGAHLIVLARSHDEVAAVAEEIDGEAIAVDVADRAATEAALAGVGDIDIVVANAGVVEPLSRFTDTDMDAWERAVTINVIGAVRAIHAVVAGMCERSWGRVITISSGAASPPGMPSANAYSTSKAALDMFALHLAHELDGTGVTVNAVRPGVVDTQMQEYMRSLPREQVGDAFFERFHGLHERGELISPVDSANFVVDVICSDRTGQVLDIRTAR